MNREDKKRIDHTADNIYPEILQTSDNVFAIIDNTLGTWRDQITEALLDEQHEGRLVDEAVVTGQVLMNMIGGEDIMSVENKKRLVTIADTIGPDHAQFVYKAAVFITKVV